MPRHLPQKDIDAATAAVEYAQQVRAFHRRRTNRNSKQRTTDIQLALKRLREAMRPLKSAQGKFPYGPQTAMAEQNRQTIRDAADAIKRERMKLWKMLPKNKRKED